MSLEERIELMETSGMISPHTKAKVNKLCALFKEMYGIELTEQNASACVTHFAMALERLDKGDEIAPASDAMMEELRQHSDYSAALYMAENIFEQISPLSQNELGYIILHIITVLGSIRKEYDKKIVGHLG